jgi:hypothetical protein
MGWRTLVRVVGSDEQGEGGGFAGVAQGVANVTIANAHFVFCAPPPSPLRATDAFCADCKMKLKQGETTCNICFYENEHPETGALKQSKAERKWALLTLNKCE